MCIRDRRPSDRPLAACPAALIYEGFARLFEHIAADVQGQGTEAAQLVAFAERCKAKT